MAKARKGGGPALLECKTYRWHTHFELAPFPDPRPKEELESWINKCPVTATERRLLAEGAATANDLRDMNAAVLEKIEGAVKYAQESPFPEPEDALEDVYAD